jgi:enterochelin esterase family protein
MLMTDASPTTHTIRSRTGSTERTCRTWDVVDGATSAILFLDGELYWDRVDAPSVLQRLTESRKIPPTTAWFLSGNGAAARHVDYVCNSAFAEFVAGEVVDRIRTEHPNVGQIVLAGLSLSGLAAAHIATRFPNAFRAVICQSPSFWWNDGRFADEFPVAPTSSPPIWVCVGDQETERGVSHPPSGLVQNASQIDGCDRVCESLRTKGYDIAYHYFFGGHDPACWRDDLALALPWALCDDVPS